jgi:hypothetical protein
LRRRHCEGAFGASSPLREAPSRTRKTTLHMLSCAGIEPAETIELHTRETIREAIQVMRYEAGLRQRVLAAFHLMPLTPAETEIYIRLRLGKVGWQGDPKIEEAVYGAVFAFTGGVPRRINTLMDRLLLNASLDGRHEIDLAGLQAVTAEILAEQQHGEAAMVTPPLVAAPSPAAAVRQPVAEPDEALRRMEARLAAMQRAYDKLAVSQAVTAPPSAPPPAAPTRWWPRLVLASSALGLVAIGLVLLARHG